MCIELWFNQYTEEMIAVLLIILDCSKQLWYNLVIEGSIVAMTIEVDGGSDL